MYVLPTCIPHACLIPKEARRRYQISLNWSYSQSEAAMLVLVSAPKQPVLSTTELSLQTKAVLFCFNWVSMYNPSWSQICGNPLQPLPLEFCLRL